MKNKLIKTTISDKEIRELVIERLRYISSSRKVSIGSLGEFTKDELIKNVQSNNDIGKKIIKIQLEYLRAFKDGLFFKEDQNANYPSQS